MKFIKLWQKDRIINSDNVLDISLIQNIILFTLKEPLYDGDDCKEHITFKSEDNAKNRFDEIVKKLAF